MYCYVIIFQCNHEDRIQLAKSYTSGNTLSDVVRDRALTAVSVSSMNTNKTYGKRVSCVGGGGGAHLGMS